MWVRGGLRWVFSLRLRIGLSRSKKYFDPKTSHVIEGTHFFTGENFNKMVNFPLKAHQRNKNQLVVINSLLSNSKQDLRSTAHPLVLVFKVGISQPITSVNQPI